MHIRSRAGRADVVVSGTVDSTTVVSDPITAGSVASESNGMEPGGVESTSTSELVTSLEALGVLLTAQADSNTNPNAITAIDGPKK